MNQDRKKIYHEIASTIRGLSMDMVENAKSGHPGLPMGCAELGAVLWGEFLRYNPKNSDWFNRDRFVLSAGHGSAWLYSILHLTGYDVTMDDLQHFRRLNSRTPGHPEKLDTDGVEVTTGPLGQGVANAVGMALSYKMLAARFNKDGDNIVTNKIVCLAGDGCLMEGVSQEACSLAGHLQLNNFILLYDMNMVTLDGMWKESCSDDQVKRFEAYGFDVIEIKDANNLEEVSDKLSSLREEQWKPTLVICHTVIGKGAPHKQGTHHAHGSPLGKEELEEAKKVLGLPQTPFYVPKEVKLFFEGKRKECREIEEAWNSVYSEWKKKHADLSSLFDTMHEGTVTKELLSEIEALDMGPKISGRKASAACIQVAAKHLPHLVGGSADLSGSDCTMIKDSPLVTPSNFSGRNVKFGVREFAMSGMANGISTTLLRPFVGTFFCFSDYGRNAVRLSCLSKHPTIFIYTHDSIGLGEDGPTHQPVEHLASFRAMPGMHLFRPGDANEVKGAWRFALSHTHNPVVFVLTRQDLPTLEETKKPYEESVGRGGYIVLSEDKTRPIDITFFSTGSELHVAVESAKILIKQHGKNVRVVSLPSFHLFEEQDALYKDKVAGGSLGLRVAVEAGSSFGWDRYVGREGIKITVDTFGRSAPIAEVMDFFGLTPIKVVARVLRG